MSLTVSSLQLVHFGRHIQAAYCTRCRRSRYAVDAMTAVARDHGKRLYLWKCGRAAVLRSMHDCLHTQAAANDRTWSTLKVIIAS